MTSDRKDLRSELCDLLNRHSREDVSDTPDFILRDFMLDALKSFEKAVNRREECGTVDAITHYLRRQT